MADLAVHDILTTFLQKDKSILDKYPKLQTNRKEVESNSKLANYLKQRPETVLWLSQSIDLLTDHIYIAILGSTLFRNAT